MKKTNYLHRVRTMVSTIGVLAILGVGLIGNASADERTKTDARDRLLKSGEHLRDLGMGMEDKFERWAFLFPSGECRLLV